MKGYGSAFELILCDDSQLKLYKLKSDLMNSINDKIDELKLNRIQASKIIKVAQSTVNRVNKGEISKLSYGLLFLMHERIKLNKGL